MHEINISQNKNLLYQISNSLSKVKYLGLASTIVYVDVLMTCNYRNGNLFFQYDLPFMPLKLNCIKFEESFSKMPEKKEQV